MLLYKFEMISSLKYAFGCLHHSEMIQITLKTRTIGAAFSIFIVILENQPLKLPGIKSKIEEHMVDVY